MVQEIQPSAVTGSSQAVLVKNIPLAHTAQFLPINKKGELIGKDNLQKQVDQVFKNITAALKAADINPANLVKVNVYVSKNEHISQVQKLFGQRFSKRIKPAVSFVTGDLAHAEADVAMDAIAACNRPVEVVTYFRSPALNDQLGVAHVAVLPAGGVTYVSGQADKGTLIEATRGTIQQLAATLEHLGISKDQVIQIKSFMQPMTDVKIVEQEFAEFFKGSTVPPLVFVDWVSKNPIIEIELIAASSAKSAQVPDQISYITPPGMTASPIYAKVTQINRGGKFYLSSFYGSSINDPAKQTGEIFTSLKNILTGLNTDFAHLAKATYYVTDEKASAALNKIRPGFYDPERPPAASKAMVKGVGKGMSINIDMIGVIKE